MMSPRAGVVSAGLEVAVRPDCHSVLGYRANQISAKQHDRPDAPIDDLFTGFDNIDSFFRRYVDAE